MPVEVTHGGFEIDGVPQHDGTALLVLYNGLKLGAMIAVFADKGLGPNFGAWLAIHGTTGIVGDHDRRRGGDADRRSS